MTTNTDVDQLVDALSGTDLFKQLSRKAVTIVAKRARVVEHPAGRVITEEGARGAGFHLILDGTAVVDRADGATATLRAGDYFGEISLIDGGPRTATVRADSAVRTAVLAPWEFGPLLSEHPEITLGLLRGLCARLRSTGAVPQPRSSA